MKKSSYIFAFCCLLATLNIFQASVYAQKEVSRDTLILAAHEIINSSTYCGLVTVDSTGQPQVRTMNPFPSNDSLVVWFATSRSSRKVKELKNNPKVCVYFADHKEAKGYVNITGKAEVIDDIDLLKKMKRDYWEGMSNWQEIFVLIKIVPETIEVINYNHKLYNDPKTFKAPVITL